MMQKGVARHYLYEVIGTGLILLGCLIAASLFSYHSHDPSFSTVSSSPNVQNAVGKMGAVFSDLAMQFLGISSHLLTLFLIVLGIKMVRAKEASRHHNALIAGFLIMAIALSSLISLGGTDPLGEGMKGGITGELTSVFLLRYFAEIGTFIILFSLLLIGAMIAFPFSPHRVFMKTMTKVRDFNKREEKPTLKKKKTIKIALPAEAELQERSSAVPDVSPPPKVVESKQVEIFDFEREDIGDYRLPTLSLLSDPALLTNRTTRQELIEQSRILQKKLRDFGIEGRVSQVHPGPVITMFEFEPAPGIKLSKITSLSDDLALGMRALSVRIVAPLPGKAAVGIEIPNLNREEVSMKEILSSPSFNRLDSKLRLALGKDIFGSPVSADLSKMPHLLIAGATGAGKSVGLNAMILSLLYTATPAEVKLVMIDPKMLEFTLYEGIPHLITPVIVKPKAASAALKKMVAEMQRRYELLSEKGVRNITAYNKLAEKSDEMNPLPYIVVCIDELADLMIVASRDIEDSIARLAQMARAAGIHLILATQRPSVDVLTGLIKANFPARIAYCVASKTDSRTILDENGAEKLLGKGDMLYSAGTGKTTRVHGCYISEEEVKKVVGFIKEQSDPHYETEFTEAISKLSELSDDSELSDERDELYEKARELVISTKQASASFIQRRMRVGYPRAARLIEMMEEDGLVGPAIGSKAREILIRKEEGETI